jgi:hypothetical protein
MFKSALVGMITPLLIIFSGWIRVIITSILGVFMGKGIPFFFLGLGIMHGIGNSYKNLSSFWVAYLSGMIFSILILKWSTNHDKKHGGENSTVSECGVI